VPKVSEEPRRAIEQQLARGVEATRRRDLDAFLAVLAPAFEARRYDGTRLNRAALREMTERAWGVTGDIREIRHAIDAIVIEGSRAIVSLRTRYRRILMTPSGPYDTLTTTMQRETWVHAGGAWLLLGLDEIEPMQVTMQQRGHVAVGADGRALQSVSFER
jgi:hypothetical protein